LSVNVDKTLEKFQGELTKYNGDNNSYLTISENFTQVSGFYPFKTSNMAQPYGGNILKRFARAGQLQVQG
jgi:hypothetical protein